MHLFSPNLNEPIYSYSYKLVYLLPEMFLSAELALTESGLEPRAQKSIFVNSDPISFQPHGNILFILFLGDSVSGSASSLGSSWSTQMLTQRLWLHCWCNSGLYLSVLSYLQRKKKVLFIMQKYAFILLSNSIGSFSRGEWKGNREKKGSEKWFNLGMDLSIHL